MAEDEKPDAPDSDIERNDDDEFGIDQKRMSFMGHLLELRWRLLLCIGTIVVATIVFLFAMRHTLFRWLKYPVVMACHALELDPEQLLFVRTPASLFMASIYYCLLAAVAVTIPVTTWQLWAFVAPGLKRRERRLVGPVILAAFVLFACGVVFGYFVLIPIMLGFFLRDSLSLGVKPIWDVAETVKLEAIMMLILGATFETPLVIVALSKLGIVSPRFLAKYRRYAILVIFILAALITPTGDPLTLTLMAAPLIVLYELGILAARFFRPIASRWDVPDDTGGGSTPPSEPPRSPTEPTGTPPESATVEPSAADDHYAPDESHDEMAGYPPADEEQGPAAQDSSAEPPLEEGAAPEAQEPLPEEMPAEPPPEEPEQGPPPPEEELPPDALMH